MFLLIKISCSFSTTNSYFINLFMNQASKQNINVGQFARCLLLSVDYSPCSLLFAIKNTFQPPHSAFMSPASSFAVSFLLSSIAEQTCPRAGLCSVSCVSTFVFVFVHVQSCALVMCLCTWVYRCECSWELIMCVCVCARFSFLVTYFCPSNPLTLDVAETDFKSISYPKCVVINTFNYWT